MKLSVTHLPPTVYLFGISTQRKHPIRRVTYPSLTRAMQYGDELCYEMYAWLVP